MTFPSFPLSPALIYPNGVDVDKGDVTAWMVIVAGALNAQFSNDVIFNGRLVPSVAANVLTVAVKTLAGNDPSSSDPVYFVFRNATLTSGLPEIIAVTSALALTISAGSTLGASSGINFRLWVVAFNDAGTVRLGVVNLYSGGVQYPLNESGVASSTAEGGAGAADSAGVIYTGTAVTSKAFRILGFMTWETALGTAGSWSAAPDVVALMGPGVRKPGDIVQRQRTASGATNTGTTTTPLDDTLPQLSTEGTTFLTQAITPQSKANLLKIRAKLFCASSAIVHVIAALHQDSTENAIAARAVYAAATNVTVELELELLMLAGTVIATTFKINIGGSGAATIRLNGVSSARLFAGIGYSILEIEELMG